MLGLFCCRLGSARLSQLGLIDKAYGRTQQDQQPQDRPGSTLPRYRLSSAGGCGQTFAIEPPVDSGKGFGVGVVVVHGLILGGATAAILFESLARWRR